MGPPAGDSVRIGISDYAQDQLGDIVFVELPEVGATLTKARSSARWNRSRPFPSSTCPWAARSWPSTTAWKMRPSWSTTPLRGRLDDRCQADDAGRDRRPDGQSGLSRGPERITPCATCPTHRKTSSHAAGGGGRILEDLFATIPEAAAALGMELPGPMTEWELNRHMDALAAEMAAAPELPRSSWGPAATTTSSRRRARLMCAAARNSHLLHPLPAGNQPGHPAGHLRVPDPGARLLGMDVATASHYDGATAMAEALLMAVRKPRQKNAWPCRPPSTPIYRRWSRTYFTHRLRSDRIALHPDGTHRSVASEAGLTIWRPWPCSRPTFSAASRTWKPAAERPRRGPPLLVAGFTEPLAYGLLKSPGSLGPTSPAARARAWASPQSFGGPGLGMFAARKAYVRNMPGRLVGQTTDRDGRRGFVLTLATREQHIRREKATSNICTNQGLCATTAAMYMASAWAAPASGNWPGSTATRPNT
jgi:glycine dehydrogenase subunit 1